MKIPPLLIGATLLFWGVQTDSVFIGLILCLIFEGRHVVKTRYHLQAEDFVKISDLTSLIFLGTIALVLLNYNPLGFLRITTGWLPLILSPLMLAQLYSTGDTIIIGTRLGKKKGVYAHKPVDFRFYYIMACIFAAATSNTRSLWFFPLLGLLLLLFLYSNRGRSYSKGAFASFVILSLFMGYGLSLGMEQGHRYVLKKTSQFWHRYYGQQHGDPYKSHVNFGDTGRMKLSGEIIMRIASDSRPPALFKEASFASYSKGAWMGNRGDYTFLQPVAEERWDLIAPPHRQGKRLQIEFNLPEEKGLLPIPHGAYQLASSTLFDLEQSREGLIKVLDGAPVVSYEIMSHPQMNGSKAPQESHVEIPAKEEYALDQVIRELKFNGASDTAKVESVREYFRNDFDYSLRLLGKGEYDTALGNFLLKHKSGFCEYYATGTALILRKMGIPSRYAIGYSVSEKSLLEGKYIVRKRHAHAWAEAYVANRWIVVDTTPPDWSQEDAEQASFLESISDFFAFFKHKYKLFQIGSGEDYTLHFSVLVVLLTAFLVFRIYRRLKIEQAGQQENITVIRSFEQVHSPFSSILDELEKRQVGRKEGESMKDWAIRCVNMDDFEANGFTDLYHLHLQFRFDPQGLSAPQTALLVNGSQKYLDIVTHRK